MSGSVLEVNNKLEEEPQLVSTHVSSLFVVLTVMWDDVDQQIALFGWLDDEGEAAIGGRGVFLARQECLRCLL